MSRRRCQGKKQGAKGSQVHNQDYYQGNDCDKDEDPEFGVNSVSKTLNVNNKIDILTSHATCDICNYSSPNKLEVLFHIRTVHCSELYSDSSCESGPVNEKGTLSKSTRVKNRPHACDTCGSAFTQKIHLETHIRNVHEMIKPFQCQLCDYTSSNKGCLDKHVKTVHNKERPYKCQLCLSSFGQKVHLESHINAIHIQDRPFGCDQCNYRATSRGLLDKHMCTVHYRERPFECDKCDAKFGQKAHLQKHVVSVHLGAKPFKCTQCCYAASCRSTLQKHVSVIHFKQRPFKCTICPNSAFGQKVHLENHLRQIHHMNK